jgi:hypothetical protein
VIREANLDNAINALMREHGIENAGDNVLYQVLDSPLLEGRPARTRGGAWPTSSNGPGLKHKPISNRMLGLGT